MQLVYTKQVVFTVAKRILVVLEMKSIAVVLGLNGYTDGVKRFFRYLGRSYSGGCIGIG